MASKKEEWVMPYDRLVAQLKNDIGVELEPVALRRVQNPPPRVQSLIEELPSACSFWRKAEQELFYVGAWGHMGCPIGAMVMGFELPKEKEIELLELVGGMCEIAYLKEEEVKNIPKFESGHSGILYGPLKEFPMEPELVLLWVTPTQAMVLQEATGETAWTLGPQAGVFGRPACAALPVSLERKRPTLSLGCMGMRTFTEIAEDRMLLSIPGGILSELEEKIANTISANQKMKERYLQKKNLL